VNESASSYQILILWENPALKQNDECNARNPKDRKTSCVLVHFLRNARKKGKDTKAFRFDAPASAVGLVANPLNTQLSASCALWSQDCLHRQFLSHSRISSHSAKRLVYTVRKGWPDSSLLAHPISPKSKKISGWVLTTLVIISPGHSSTHCPNTNDLRHS